jgi:hypothetical protein
MSMLSDSVTVPSVRRSPALRFGGDFSGDEKMPETGSMPYSSRRPLSSSVMPVFLANISDGNVNGKLYIVRTFPVRQHCRIGFRDSRVCGRQAWRAAHRVAR